MTSVGFLAYTSCMTMGKNNYYYLCTFILEGNAYNEASKFWDGILSCSRRNHIHQQTK